MRVKLPRACAYDSAARRAFRAGRPVVVLLDIKMPKVSGLEVLKIIKSDEQLKIIPVVILSSSRETPDLVECYRHGVNAYVVKPVDFVATLERGNLDLVIADFALPKFDGLSALEIVRAKWPDLPFILVSGTVGEEFAIEALRNGATDYVFKDRLSRLVPTVRRALSEVEARAERRRLEAQLLEAQKGK